jgi:hypothetical protein
MELKFIDGDLPGKSQQKHSATREALRRNPGVWAEVERFPLDRRSTANNFGQALAGRYVDLEYTARRFGDEIVVYARAVSA